MRWLLTTVNPEANMNVSEIISYWDYIYEEYEVVTQDGYILPVYRIPQGKNESSNLGNITLPKPVVYLQHGWTLSASIWLVNPPSSSLGFLLADAGFDVWLGNSRGNTYARKHARLDPDSKEFWAFRAFGAFSTNPHLAQKIKKLFLLGPVATVKYISGLVRTIAYMGKTTTKILFGEKDIFSSSDAKYFVEFLCQRKTIGSVCNNLLTLLFGYNPQNLNESRFDVYAGQAPAGTSVQTMLHYSQPTPPLYKVKDMKVPTAMWSGGRDFLADPIDVEKLKPNISNLIYHKKIADYSHLDFVIGLDAPKKVFNEIVTFIKEDN
ncbi:Lipase member K [Apodemus speciosus]|uniref:Lipase member K n=1 Tax=Apodemus speciosus TaxID=105296 RepID=A0ABQ0FT50_APOSI